MWVDLKPNWKGANLDRLVNGAHAALQERCWPAAGLDGWVANAEVSFAMTKERGIIDILARPGSRTLLIIELKTLLVDPAGWSRRDGPADSPRGDDRPATTGQHPQRTWRRGSSSRTPGRTDAKSPRAP
ncbi:MAG: hypothetical protein R3C32_06265 [Chloroflexota bacterium]